MQVTAQIDEIEVEALTGYSRVLAIPFRQKAGKDHSLTLIFGDFPVVVVGEKDYLERLLEAVTPLVLAKEAG